MARADNVVLGKNPTAGLAVMRSAKSSSAWVEMITVRDPARLAVS